MTIQERPQLQREQSMLRRMTFEEHVINGERIEVRSKFFPPTKTPEKPVPKHEAFAPDAVFFIPGWSLSVKSRTMEDVAREMANTYQVDVYSYDTRNHNLTDETVRNEAEAKRLSIADVCRSRNLKNIIVAGVSQGGFQAINVTASLQENNPEINILGLALLAPVGLYPQRPEELVGGLVYDSTVKMALSMWHNRKKPKNLGRGWDMMVDVAQGLGGEILQYRTKFVSRTLKEVESFKKSNANVEKLKVPVVIITGEGDPIMNPDKFIPEDPEMGVPGWREMDLSERERYLKERELHPFKNAPFVRFITGGRNYTGTHGLGLTRSSQVIRVFKHFFKEYHLDKWAEERGFPSYAEYWAQEHGFGDYAEYIAKVKDLQQNSGNVTNISKPNNSIGSGVETINLRDIDTKLDKASGM